MLLQSDPSRLCISSFLVDSLAKASIAQHRRRMSGHSDWCLNLRNGLAAGCCVVVLLLLSLLCLVAPCGGVLLLLCVSVCFLLLTTLLRGGVRVANDPNRQWLTSGSSGREAKKQTKAVSLAAAIARSGRNASALLAWAGGRPAATSTLRRSRRRGTQSTTNHWVRRARCGRRCPDGACAIRDQRKTNTIRVLPNKL